MSNEAAREVFKAHREAQEKYVYFLLAAAGAAIGLAVTRTSDTALAWAHVPLGLAVACWGISFFFGCQRVLHAHSVLALNLDLLDVQRGVHALTGSDPAMIAYAQEVIRESVEAQQNKVSQGARFQFYFLIAGAILFIAWHVLDMYLRRIAE